MLNLDLRKIEWAWHSLPIDITLKGHEVHFWRANPDQESKVFREPEETLSTGKLGMAMGFALQHELS